MSPNEKKQTADGIELTFGVNHVGPHLLTKELVPLLQAGAPARVVFVSSSVQKTSKLDLDDFPEVHDGDPRANVFDQSEIVRDEQIGQLQLPL